MAAEPTEGIWRFEQYSPLWQVNYVLVPQDYEPNTLRSEADCLASDHPVLKSTVVEN